MGGSLTVFNQKGGVGKTTTALNLAAAMARRGLHPLMIDLDPQAHLSSILGQSGNGASSMFAFFSEEKKLSSLMRPITFGGNSSNGSGDLLPAHAELLKVDTLFGKGPNVLNRLRIGVEENFQTQGTRPVMIDCCPMLGVLSLSGVFASERVLIPISTDFLALKGALHLETTLGALEHVLKRRVERRYVLTRFDARRRMSHDIAAQLDARFGAELCRTRVAENVAVAESPSVGKDIFSHAPQSRGAADYQALLDELTGSGFLTI
ncbi:MAG: ParA family protein [Burkholderiales bacterium]